MTKVRALPSVSTKEKKKKQKTLWWKSIVSAALQYSLPMAVSPVGSAALDVPPALPLWEDPSGGPRTSKGIEIHPLLLLSGVAPEGLGRRWWLQAQARGRAPLGVNETKPVVGVLVVVPEGLVLGLVLDAELDSARKSEVVGHRDGEGEGVCVRAAVDVVHVQAGDVLEGAPRVEGDPDPHPLVEREVLDLDRPGEETLLDGAGLQTHVLRFEPVPQMQVVCCWFHKV